MPDDPRQEPGWTPPRGRCPSRPKTKPIRALVDASRMSMRQGHGRADADRGAVDRGDHRLGQGVDRQRHPAAGVAQPVVVRRLVVVRAELLRRRRAATRRGRRRCPRAERSMPAQNARPAPVTTTARTSSDRASVRKNLSSSRAMVRSNALSWPGRSRVSVATPSSSSAIEPASRRARTSLDAAGRRAEALRRWRRSRP